MGIIQREILFAVCLGCQGGLELILLSGTIQLGTGMELGYPGCTLIPSRVMGGISRAVGIFGCFLQFGAVLEFFVFASISDGQKWV